MANGIFADKIRRRRVREYTTLKEDGDENLDGSDAIITIFRRAGMMQRITGILLEMYRKFFARKAGVPASLTRTKTTTEDSEYHGSKR